MSDGQTEVVAAGEPVQPTTPAPETKAVSIIGDDGKFSENWREKLSPELKNDKTLMQFKDFDGLCRTVVNQQRMIGLDKKRLVEVPDDKAPDNIRNEFYKAAGRPEKPEEYKFAKDPDIAEEVWDNNLIQSSLVELHKAGASQKVIDTIAKIENGRVKSMMEIFKQNGERLAKEGVDAMKVEYGAKYDRAKHLANTAISMALGENKEAVDAFVNKTLSNGLKLGDDPDFFKFAATLGESFSEHSNVKLNQMPAQSNDEIQTKINELMASKEYLDAKHINHKSTLEQITKLYQQKHARK